MVAYLLFLSLFASPATATLSTPWEKVTQFNNPKSQFLSSCGPLERIETQDCQKFSEELSGFDSQHPPFRRLSSPTTGSEKNWTLFDENGRPLVPLLKLPPMSRVVLLEPTGSNKKFSRVLITDGSQVRSGYLPQSALASASPTGVNTTSEIQAYLDDARLNLNLAREMAAQKPTAPEFKTLVNNLEKNLNCVEGARSRISDSEWSAFKNKIKNRFQNDEKNKAETLARYQNAIRDADNPSGTTGTLSDRTLIVPLSKIWFDTNFQLKTYFERRWDPKKNDVRIIGGGSGEGIARTADLPDDAQYGDMFQRFRDLKKFIETSGDVSLQNSSEYAWLKKTTARDPNSYDRMIFIHEDTWKTQAKNLGWQEYIAVDQSMGPIQSHPLMSVLIHEINVNSYNPSFLPDDTHSPYGESARLWNCAASQGSAVFANKSAADRAKILGLQPYLGTITLGMSLPDLAKSLGCGP